MIDSERQRNRHTNDIAFLKKVWPSVVKAMDFVLCLQDESGVIYHGYDKNGEKLKSYDCAACSSCFLGIISAALIAGELGYIDYQNIYEGAAKK
jgi:uncharacterized protein (DUF608 family)